MIVMRRNETTALSARNVTMGCDWANQLTTYTDTQAADMLYSCDSQPITPRAAYAVRSPNILDKAVLPARLFVQCSSQVNSTCP